MRIRHYGLLANRHGTEHLAACRVALDAPTPAPREQKPSRPSSLACSGPMSTAAPTVAKDGCTRSELSPLSLGPPAHRSSDGRHDPLPLPAPATSTEAATDRFAPTPRLTPSGPLTILHDDPEPGVRAGRSDHDRHAEPLKSRPSRPPAHYNPQGSYPSIQRFSSTDLIRHAAARRISVFQPTEWKDHASRKTHSQ
jgi:hypothetical protein